MPFSWGEISFEHAEVALVVGTPVGWDEGGKMPLEIEFFVDKLDLGAIINR
jgi:hypothetical protein